MAGRGEKLWNTPASRSVIRSGWVAWARKKCDGKTVWDPEPFLHGTRVSSRIVGVTMRCAMQRKAVQARCAVVRLANRDLSVQPAIRFFRLLSLDVSSGFGCIWREVSMWTLLGYET